jgi:hypothetical protein
MRLKVGLILEVEGLGGDDYSASKVETITNVPQDQLGTAMPKLILETMECVLNDLLKQLEHKLQQHEAENKEDSLDEKSILG